MSNEHRAHGITSPAPSRGHSQQPNGSLLNTLLSSLRYAEGVSRAAQANLSLLIGRVLADRGNAVLVMADPGDGEDAVILTVNAPFERLIGKTAKLLSKLAP